MGLYARAKSGLESDASPSSGRKRWLVGDLDLTNNYRSFWMNGDVLTQRPEFTKTFNKMQVQADGEDETTMSDLAKGATVRIIPPLGAPMTEVVTDSVGLTLSFDEPGTWNVEVEEFPCVPKTFEIEAVE